MKKNVYSLVLSEDVVDAVDRMAYARNTSRSNLVNQLLAEAVGYVTPEAHMAEILSTLSQQMTGLFQLQEQASDGMLTIRSPLRYRYKPTIRYRVELNRQSVGHPEHAIGVLHASFRTQSQPLIAEAESFFRCWAGFEMQYLGISMDDFHIEDGTWHRHVAIRTDANATAQEIGATMGTYIKSVDAALKSYFAALPDHEKAIQAVETYFIA